MSSLPFHHAFPPNSPRLMLPAAGGSLPLVIQFNTSLVATAFSPPLPSPPLPQVVLSLLQLCLALGLANLVARTDTPPSAMVTSNSCSVFTQHCFNDLWTLYCRCQCWRQSLLSCAWVPYPLLGDCLVWSLPGQKAGTWRDSRYTTAQYMQTT